MKKILVVDDQADIRKLIRMTLEFEAFEIHEAADGQAALQQVQSLRPDLVLLDVMMPGALDGFEVCRAIKTDPAHRGTPVVLLSARGRAEDLEAGQRCGADQYLVKPFGPLQLLEIIQRITGQA